MSQDTEEKSDEEEGLGNRFDDEDVWGSSDQSSDTSDDDIQRSEGTEETGDAKDITSADSTQSPRTKPKDQQKTYRKDELPHKLKRDSVKEERESLTIFLSSDDKNILNRLRFVADNEFDEQIHTIDVYLAAIRCGISGTEEEVKESFIDEMESIGYGF